MLPDDFAAPQRGAQWHSGGGVQSLNTLWEWAGTSLGEGRGHYLAEFLRRGRVWREMGTWVKLSPEHSRFFGYRDARG